MSDEPSGPNSRSGYSEHFRRPGEVSPRKSGSVDDRFKLLYDELRQRAAALLRQESPGHTLQPTALVHEAFMKLAPQDKAQINNDSQALALAAIAMRRVLVDHARTKHREKRGGAQQPRPLDANMSLAGESPQFDALELLGLNAALEQLEAEHPRIAKLIELRFFGGLTNPQVAQVLGVSIGTVENDWKQARELLLAKLSGS
ncbi:MAG: ECF-type sigma factor [Planctomycetota bacterium]|nr:ECF-type sigma factor [Planctomycetota bacterium]